MDGGGGVCVSASTLSGGEYLDFPVEGNSIKNVGLNRLIYVYIIYSQDTVIDNIIAILYECEMRAV